MGAREIEVVARPVEVRRQQEDRVEAVLLAVRRGADEQRLLGDAVRSVGLLGVPVPEVLLAERHGRELRVGADGAGEHELGGAVQPRLLEHVGAHHQVRVPVAPGVGPVGADAADLGREVEHDLRLGLVEQPGRVGHVGEVDLDAPRDGDVVAVGLEALDEVRAEEPATACDENPAHDVGAIGAPVESQSTRPIQRSRFSAYQRIVCRTPSSHETCGIQPVSRVSLSWPTRSAITSLAPGR